MRRLGLENDALFPKTAQIGHPSLFAPVIGGIIIKAKSYTHVNARIGFMSLLLHPQRPL